MATGALFGLLSVAAGAFGAHALKDRLTPYSLGIWNTAAQYQMYHALALLLIGVLANTATTFRPLLKASTWCFVIGVLIFSATLYALALSGLKILGAITPLGGLLLLIGWLCLLAYALRIGRK
jgi:uncharacterized membrane protein YgdD (TMEM256/DUF423 family)